MNEAVTHPTGQRIPNGMLEDNYPRNMWWVAAYSKEVTTKPISRWLLETPVFCTAWQMARLQLSMIGARTGGRLCQRVTLKATRSSAPITAWSSTQAGIAPKRPLRR